MTESKLIHSIAGKNILVTGATGFIGSYLTRRLSLKQAKVTVLVRSPEKAKAVLPDSVVVVAGDIRESSVIQGLFDQQFDVVIHVAAWLHGFPISNFRVVNVDATRALAEASAANGVRRFVFISSIAVYGLHGNLDVSEGYLTRPYGDPYGDSKIIAEREITQISKSKGLQFAIVRPGMVYGPQSAGWTLRIAELAKKGLLPIVDEGRGMAYPVYIENLIDLIELATTRPKAANQIFNAVDDGPVSLATFFSGYQKMTDTTRAVHAPGWLVKAVAQVANPFVPLRNLNYVASQLCGTGQVLNAKAKEVLGWKPQVSLSQGLVECEKWLRQIRIIN